jgi:hypothetical protein
MTQHLVTGLLMLAGVVCAQHSVDPRNTYDRVFCVVPMIGSGTAADPRRPQYAPAPGRYTVTVDEPGGLACKQELDMTEAGIYRDRVLSGATGR